MDKKSPKERSNNHGRFTLRCSLVSKDTPKKILGLYFIQKRHNVKFKIYLESSNFCATFPTLTEHHAVTSHISIKDQLLLVNNFKI